MAEPLYRVDLVDEEGECVYPSEPGSREDCLDMAPGLLWLFGEEAAGWELVCEATGQVEMVVARDQEVAGG